MIPRVRATAALRAFAVCVGVLVGDAAVGQTVDVQSGEHATFTRLVLDIGRERTWAQSVLSEREVRLAFEPAVEGFELDGVFTLIPRTRLAGLAEDGGLRLDLACDCVVTASRYRERYLIVDIADGPANPPEVETADAAPVSAPPFDPETNVSTDTAAAQRLAAAEALPDLARLALEMTEPETSLPLPAERNASDQRTPTAEVELEDAARIMAAQLVRAAASGLLDIAPEADLASEPGMDRADRAAPPAPEPPEDRAPPLPPEAAAPAVAPAPTIPPIRTENAFEAAIAPDRLTPRFGAELVCGSIAAPVATWASGEGVTHGLGRLREALYDEAGTIQPNRVEDLARHYLFYGFGAEAAFWLSQLREPPPDLIALADLVDGAERVGLTPIGDPDACDDETLLWHFLAETPGVPDTEDVVRRVQRAVAGLPPDLRDNIGLRLARRFFQLGFPNAARNLRDMLVRGQRLPTNTLMALDLDLGLEAGHPQTTRDALTQALRDDGAEPAILMAHALRFDRGAGVEISETRLIAAEALLREIGTGAASFPLWSEIVFAHAARGDVTSALSYLAAEGMPRSFRDRALTTLFADRVAARDIAGLFIVARVFGADWRAEGSEAGRARVAAMALLREAGLNEAANALSAGQRLLILPSRPEPDPTPQADLQTAWHEADWAHLQSASGPPHRTVATRMVERVAAAPTDADETLELSQITRTVADSAVLRRQVQALLEFPQPRLAGVEEEE
jgi:DNA-directed RNA polymerase specialized sigma24 family protein